MTDTISEQTAHQEKILMIILVGILQFFLFEALFIFESTTKSTDTQAITGVHSGHNHGNHNNHHGHSH